MSNENDHSTNPSKTGSTGSIIEILGCVARQAPSPFGQSGIPDEALSALASHGKSAVEQMRAENGLPVRRESLI